LLLNEPLLPIILINTDSGKCIYGITTMMPNNLTNK